ncbi:hypothetical protein BGZ94_001227 [Podila epigama]|nr:hypothetical protein BGZ94_001227 [Podila epigama]
MSDLRQILERLVHENLHGPIDPRTYQDSVKNHALHQSANNAHDRRSHRQGGGGGGGGNYDPEDDHDLDMRDPRWRQLFQEFFLGERSNDGNDDLLFFVRRPEAENGGVGSNNVDPVFVKRKVKGKGLQILTSEQEAVVIWKDTFFLNVIVQLNCKLTVAICSRVAETNPLTGITKTSMTCTRKHVSKRVYALPTKSRMDVKEESVECSWPLIYYVIDDFEDSFEQLMVRDNEYLCVELAVTIPSSSTSLSSAERQNYNNSDNFSNPTSPTTDGPQVGRPFPAASKTTGKVTLFQGAAGFQSLLGIYQQKSASKVGRRFKIGPHVVPTEFIMMRGPGGKGHAQVAITASNVREESSAPASPVQQPPPPPPPPRQHQQQQQQQYYHNANTPPHSTPTSPIPSSKSITEKSLPPIPTSTSANRNGHDTHSQASEKTLPAQAPAPGSPSFLSSLSHAPPLSPSSSSPKSFTSGSFFQSLRRISMATLAQAAGQHASSGGGQATLVHALNQNPKASSSNQTIASNGGTSSDIQAPNSSSSSMVQDGVGSRQEIEDLVRRPLGLRCCMTFVNVPWTSIATMLMDQAYTLNATQQL